MEKESAVLSREELYDRVWTTPMRQLAEVFGLSDVGLAKICDRHDVPRPGRGYWAKKEHGKAVEQTPLPQCSNPELQNVRLTPSGTIEEAVPLAKTFVDPELGAQAERMYRDTASFSVPANLRSPHPLVVRTHEGLLAATKQQRRGTNSLLGPRRADDKLCLSVEVGANSIGRAMRIMDVLLKYFDKCGYLQVEVHEPAWRRGLAWEAPGQAFRLRLRELLVRHDHVPTAEEREHLKRSPGSSWVPKWDYSPSGKLQLELRNKDLWHTYCTLRDGKRQRVEDYLADIAIAILRQEDDAKRDLVWRAEEALRQAEIARQRQVEAERLRLEKQQQKEEQERVDMLFENAESWHRSQILRAFLVEIRQAAEERHGAIEQGSNVANWLVWAEDVANQCDPVTNYRSETSNRRASPDDASARPSKLR